MMRIERSLTLTKVAALHVLEHEVVLRTVGSVVDGSLDMRVRQRSGDRGLTLVPLEDGDVGEQRRIRRLDDDESAISCIVSVTVMTPCEIRLRIRPGAQRLDDLVAVDDGSR
jgi:hypothetical protein